MIDLLYSVHLLRETVLITGASGFIGGAIAERIIDRHTVRSLSSHPARNRFGNRVRTFPYDFEKPDGMVEAFRGVDVFVNSFYVRFHHGPWTYSRAVEQSRALVSLAREAGVRKIVHVSVSNAREDSDLPYYANKGRIERLVRESGVEHTILRPAIVVGAGDILVNNIAYFLRRLPVFRIFGRGNYRVQPMTADGFAEVAVDAIAGAYRNATLAVAGPRDWTFLDMVRAIRAAAASRAVLVRAPAWVALVGLRAAGLVLGDVVLTRDEIKGLTREYLYASGPLRCGDDFQTWLDRPETAQSLGRQYESELERHFRK